MADELVYRIVLDGQDESSPGSSRSSGARSRPFAEPDPQAEAYAAAQARMRREEQAELADRTYRAMKRGVKPSVIEEEDHQAKLDRMEAEAEARKQAERRARDSQDPYKLAEEALRRQEMAENVRLAMQARKSGGTIESERQREEDERIRRETEKALDEQEREAARREAEEQKARREADKALRDKQMQDPVFLANEAIKREKLMEQTRLQYEATKRGVTPEQIANEERAKESARAMSGNLQTRAGIINSAISGGPMGLIKGLGGLNSIMAPITSTITNLASAAFESAGQIREVQLRATRFSPEVIMAKIKNRIKELNMDLDFSKNNGPEVAERERRLGKLNRMSKQEDLNANAGLAAEGEKRLEIIGKRARNDFFKLVLGLTDLVNDPVEFITRDLRAKQAANPIANRPPPFQFVADRAFQAQVGHRRKQARTLIDEINRAQGNGMQLPAQ